MQLFIKKIFGPAVTTLIILNEEMNNILKTVKSVEESRLLIKGLLGNLLTLIWVGFLGVRFEATVAGAGRVG